MERRRIIPSSDLKLPGKEANRRANRNRDGLRLGLNRNTFDKPGDKKCKSRHFVPLCSTDSDVQRTARRTRRSGVLVDGLGGPAYCSMDLEVQTMACRTHIDQIFIPISRAARRAQARSHTATALRRSVRHGRCAFPRLGPQQLSAETETRGWATRT